MKYKWLIKENENPDKDLLKVAFESKVIAKLLLNRGITSAEKANAFLNPEHYVETNPEEIVDLIKAKDRIIRAIKNKEQITIFGDYDVDGVTSTACLLLTLRQFTDKVDFYIPSRLTEGYGLNSEAVRTISKNHIGACPDVETCSGVEPCLDVETCPDVETCRGKSLLITCDCGITNHAEVELANSLGMDVIVTDHHSLPEQLPNAHAVLNPKVLPPDHKLYWLPGVGVAYKLAEEILRSSAVNRAATDIITSDDLLDLVTLGMIADLAPLVDENRYLVQIGLKKLASTQKVGLKELLRMCGCLKEDKTSPTTEHIGFGIAPRINAVGRLSDASLAVKLLVTNDLFEAVSIASELDVQNRERQEICEQTVEEAIALVSEQVDLKKDKCIILAKENWHHGVIGIVASRLVEKYGLPTILIAIDNEQNIARGSGRSVEKLNLIEAATQCSGRLEKFGGHKAACGLSIKPKNLNSFMSEFKEYVNELLSKEELYPNLTVDMELNLSELNIDLIEKIYKISPFGLANKMPVFSSNEVEVSNMKRIGKTGQHLKFYVREINSNNKNLTYEALMWNCGSNLEMKVGSRIKLAYTPKLNAYAGEVFLQLDVKDWDMVVEQKIIDAKILSHVSTKTLLDFRNRTDECFELFSKEDSVFYFAEVSQKDFLPLKTSSRASIHQADNLVILEVPPDQSILVDLIQQVQPKNIYLATSSKKDEFEVKPQDLLKRLIGMLRFVKNEKDSKVKESELQAALGLDKSALAFLIEVLNRVGLANVKKNGDELSIDILIPTRQNYQMLIEYNLFVARLKEINEFRSWFSGTSLANIKKLLSYVGIEAKEVNIQEIERIGV